MFPPLSLLLPNLTEARLSAGVCALDGKICCIGGWNGKFGSRKCDMYDPATNKWAPMASLNVGKSRRRPPRAAAVGTGHLVFSHGGLLYNSL